MSQIHHHVLVVGGGIAGLTAALCLLERGARVTLVERNEDITEYGAGLQISPNGAAVLAALGLRPMLAKCSTDIKAVRLCDGLTGKRLLGLDFSVSTERYGRPYRSVHRADLVDLLKVAAVSRGVTMRFGANAIGAMGGEVPKVVLASGETIAADVVVGADGVRSVIRDAVPGLRQPTFTGQVAWRAMVPLPEGIPAEARVDLLPGRHVVTYPVAGRKLLNIVAVEETDEWTEEGWHHVGDPESLRSRFSDLAPEQAAHLAAVSETRYWGLFNHPVPERWSDGGLVLIGDAVHPTLPFLAQGANLALEDGWMLAAALSEAGDVRTALQRFTERRRDRVRRVVQAAARNATIYHLKGRVRSSAHLAAQVLDRIAPTAALRRFDWLYGYDVTKG